MKKKFILGISLLIIIFFLFGIFIFQTLKATSVSQKIKNDHQIILTMYLEILSKTQRAMIHLHQYKSGLRKEYDSIIKDVLDNDEIIDNIRNNYATSKFKAMCNECHNVDQKLIDLSRNLKSHQEAFKNAVSPVIASVTVKQMLDYQGDAIREGNSIIESINDMWLKSSTMNTDMQAVIEAKEKQAQNLIVIFLFLTIVSSSIILFIMIRSISEPINRLVAGIKMISEGHFDSKVDIVSNDEFGYIAKNFNDMADNLKNSIQERDAVSQELNELNCTLEQRIRQKTQELKKAYDDLIRTEGLAIAGTIASTIAHELSTPLSTLTGYCQLISRKMPKENGLTEYCNLMEKEIKRCSHVMKEMLDLTRIPDDEKSLIDINATITDLLLVLSLQAKSANISIIDEFDPSLPHIMANGLSLRQVFMNIIMNAIEAMPDGGEIRIATSLAEAGDNIKISIGDTGRGIPESDISNIFESFYTTKKTGTGLGLSICYAITKAHEGDIIVRSEIGKGTTFDVLLPV